MTTRRCVLVIDDDENHRLVTGRVLERLQREAPFDLEMAEGGSVGLAKLARLVDAGIAVLVLCDYKMPEMDGLAVLRATRSRHPGKPIRFVMFTSVEQAEVEQESLRLGADEFVTKPIELDQFRLKLQQRIQIWMRTLGGGAKRFDRGGPGGALGARPTFRRM